MLQDRLSNVYSGAAETNHAHRRDDRVLTYVWINDKPVDTRKTEHLCGVPLNYLDKAYENARRYPDTDVHIWIDLDLLDEQSRYFIQSHHYLRAQNNVRILNLRDLPGYAEHSTFGHESKANIWNKVDFARFMVLSYEFKNDERRQVFYCDFDIEDADLDNPITQERLADTGMAFAKLENGETVTHGLRNNIAHGFVAMDRSRQEYLDNKLLPELSLAAERNYRVVMYLFRSVFKAVCDLDPAQYNYHSNVERIFTDVKVPPIKYDIPADTRYSDMKLCPPGFER